MSMEDYASSDPELVSSYTYTGVWDAEMIYGCSCGVGYQGYDCSEFACPSGDDPLTTTLTSNEVQLLQCQASEGTFTLIFNYDETVAIDFDATAAEFKAILEGLDSIHTVTVEFSDTTDQLCNEDTENIVSVTFTQNFGPQPVLKLEVNGLLRSTTVTVNGVDEQLEGTVDIAADGDLLGSILSVSGDKENEACSNRGTCDLTIGECSCFKLPRPGFVSSDGYGGFGPRGDCGAVDATYFGVVADCPGEVECSGHGSCADDPTYRCDCSSGWQAGDCSERTCPVGVSWFAYATATDYAHSERVECSNRGTCDTTTGECVCQSGFTGAACEYMSCPSTDNEAQCSGHGSCLSVAELALRTTENEAATDYTYGLSRDQYTWDHDKVYGCNCDDGWIGYDCTLRACQKGDDPSTYDQSDEVQLVQCHATGGSFQLMFREEASGSIAYDATADEIATALEESDSIRSVEVELLQGTQACSPGYNDTDIVFVPAMPLLVVGYTAYVGTVRVSAEPHSDLIVTPYVVDGSVGDVDFDPTSLTFGPDVTELELLVTPSVAGAIDVAWVLSGDYATVFTAPTGESTTVHDTIGVSSNSPILEGYTSYPYTVQLFELPGSYLEFTVSTNSTDLVVSTTDFNFTASDGVFSDTFTLTPASGTAYGGFEVYFSIDGANVADYTAPDTFMVMVVADTAEEWWVSVPSLPSLQAGDTSSDITVTLQIPPDTNFTLSIDAGAAADYLTLSLTELFFTSDGTDQNDTFTITTAADTPEATYTLTYTLSGQDATAYSTPAAGSLYVRPVGSLFSVTFSSEGGDVPAMYGVVDSLTDYAHSGSDGSGVIRVATDGEAIGNCTSAVGDTEWEYCSRRGECRYDSGFCDCYTGYGNSDGLGGQGTVNDCGYHMTSNRAVILEF